MRKIVVVRENVRAILNAKLDKKHEQKSGILKKEVAIEK